MLLRNDFAEHYMYVFLTALYVNKFLIYFFIEVFLQLVF